MVTPTREKRPAGLEWTERDAPPESWTGRPRPPSISAWACGPIFVISELSLHMEAPDGDGTTPQWLVTISAKGARPSAKQTRKALRAFGMTEAEEDNHAPGIARGFFLVVDPARRVACQCKTTEAVVVESDGYRWSKDLTGSPCIGCELGREAGMPCPEHGS
jgi:hypothetical protein